MTTNDDSRAPVLDALNKIGAALADLDGDELRLATLAGAVRVGLGLIAKHNGWPFEAMLEFFLRRLGRKAPTRNLMTATDQVVFDFPDCAAVGLVVIGGENEGACSSFTRQGDDQVNRTLLVRALHGLANGLARHEEISGQIRVDVRTEKPS